MKSDINSKKHVQNLETYLVLWNKSLVQIVAEIRVQVIKVLYDNHHRGRVT